MKNRKWNYNLTIGTIIAVIVVLMAVVGMFWTPYGPTDMDFMLKQLDKRKPHGSISTARKESDMPKIVSGVFEGKTTGTPITILMDNHDQKSKDYSLLKDIARPSHADYVANSKYRGYQDYRGGGHFSGRLTAPIVAAGAIALQLLKQNVDNTEKYSSSPK